MGSDRRQHRQVSHHDLYDTFPNCVAIDDPFIPMLTNENILSVVVQLLGAHIQLMTSHLIYKHPAPPRPVKYRPFTWLAPRLHPRTESARQRCSPLPVKMFLLLDRSQQAKLISSSKSLRFQKTRPIHAALLNLACNLVIAFCLRTAHLARQGGQPFSSYTEGSHAWTQLSEGHLDELSDTIGDIAEKT